MIDSWCGHRPPGGYYRQPADGARRGDGPYPELALLAHPARAAPAGTGGAGRRPPHQRAARRVRLSAAPERHPQARPGAPGRARRADGPAAHGAMTDALTALRNALAAVPTGPIP